MSSDIGGSGTEVDGLVARSWEGRGDVDECTLIHQCFAKSNRVTGARRPSETVFGLGHSCVRIEKLQGFSLLYHPIPWLSGDISQNDSHVGRVSGVARQPLKMSTLTSLPHSKSTTARKTSPLFPVLLDTLTSLAVILPRDEPFELLCPSSRATEEVVRGRTLTGFQADELLEASRARKYDKDVLSASFQDASSLNVSCVLPKT